MNKFLNISAILAVAALSLTACNKAGGGAAHTKFVNMCKEDPRAKEQGFDCNCQADIITAVLKTEEMDRLVNFLDVEKKDQAKAMELGKDPSYAPMFQKIAGIGLAIHDKCADPSKAPAPQAAPPAASAPAPAASAPAPAVKAAPAAKPAAAEHEVE